MEIKITLISVIINRVKTNQEANVIIKEKDIEEYRTQVKSLYNADKVFFNYESME